MMNKKISAVALAGAMMLSMGTTVFAEESTIPNVDDGAGNATVTKNFEMAEGLSTPNYTFRFEATPKGDAPQATIEAVSFNEGDQRVLENGKYTIAKDTAIKFGTFPHAGVYEYTIKEVTGSDNGVTYSKDTYTIRVYVVNEGNGLKIEKITAEGKDGKKDKILFTNTYKKNASLMIEKATTGKQADKTKQFSFTVKFHKSATEGQLADFEGKLTRKGGSIETVRTSKGSASFTLADGDRLVFENLPVGTTYVVTEAGVKDGYTPNVTVVENGVTTVTKQKGTDENDLSSLHENKNNLVGENDNKVSFENVYQDVAITGIIMNNLPFVLLIGVALVAFGALAVVKKRKTAER